MRVRAGVILVSGGRLAVIRRVREGRTYYVIPGGGVEEGETPEQAAAREAYEELGVRVELGPLAATVSFNGNTQYYFGARVVDGEFGTGVWPDLAGQDLSQRGSYTPVWVDLSQVESLDVRPAALARAVAAPGWAERESPLLIVEMEGVVLLRLGPDGAAPLLPRSAMASLPGGLLRPGETRTTAACRVAREALGVEAEPDYLGSHTLPAGAGACTVHLFAVRT